MNKMTLQDLIPSLTEKYGLEPSKAEAFIKAMFDTMSNGLIKDESVKIKGLGTFKVVGVESRESVNVNTGERLVIEGHRKINFTPEQVVREIVNKPFAQFETVVLNEGVDFSDVDKSESSLLDQLNENVFPDSNDGTVDDNLSEEPECITDKTESSETNTIENRECGTIVDSESNVVEDNDPEIIVNCETSKVEKNEIAVVEEPEDDEPILILSENQLDEKVAPVDGGDVKTEETTDNVGSDNVEECVAQEPSRIGEHTVDDSEEEKSVSPVVDDGHSDTEVEDDGNSTETQQSKWPIFVVAVVFALIVGLVSFYVGFCVGQRNVGISIAEMLTCNRQTDGPTIKKMQNAPIKHKVKTIPSVAKNTAVANPVQNKDSVAKKPIAEEKVANDFDSEKYDRRNRMVKYGAYRIVGVERTVTLKSGESLNWLAVKNFGSKDMLCYILAMNDMSKDDIVKEGQKIMIPKLELRHKKRK